MSVIDFSSPDMNQADFYPLLLHKVEAAGLGGNLPLLKQLVPNKVVGFPIFNIATDIAKAGKVEVLRYLIELWPEIISSAPIFLRSGPYPLPIYDLLYQIDSTVRPKRNLNLVRASTPTPPNSSSFSFLYFFYFILDSPLLCLVLTIFIGVLT